MNQSAGILVDQATRLALFKVTDTSAMLVNVKDLR